MLSTAPIIPATALAIVLQEQGDIELMKLDNVLVRLPEKNEVLLKVEWSGVNFIDLYNRNGIYKHPVPLVIGNEPAGTIVAIGADVKHLSVGDKAVGFTGSGAYSQYVTLKGDMTAKLPEGITTKVAATCFLQGLTALTNVLSAHEVKRGEYVLIHAIAGGVGSLLSQLCKSLGAIVIGTCSTEEKAKKAREAGADHVLLYSNRSMVDVIKEVKALTPNGEGVAAVFDGVGKDTFDTDFDVVKRLGTIVLLGAASGPVPPFAPMLLQPKSLKIIRPGCGAYIATLPEFQFYSDKLWQAIKTGTLKLSLYKEEGYPFTNEGVQQSHRDLGGRGTTGKLLIAVAP